MSVMAGQDRNVQVSLTADVSGYQRAIQDAGKATNGLLAGVEKLTVATNNLVKSAGKKIAFVGVGDLAALTGAAAAANKLDEAMTQVRANSAVTGQSVGALRRQVLDLSKTIPDSTNNIARLVGQIQSLGIQGTQNIRQFTATAERLGAATQTAPGQLLAGIVQMNREMGNGLSTVQNYSSALIELSKTNGVAAGDILGFAQSIQSVAQQAGYTQTQVMGLATAFTRVGADSGQAANVFVSLTSQINQAIVSNSAQLNQFASLVGMTRDQFKSLAQAHPEQAFTRVIDAIQGQGQRGILTLQQFGLDGPRALRVIAALTSGQANLGQSMSQASNAYSRNTALTKSSESAWSDLSATMQKFRNMLNEVAVQMGGPMGHVLNTFFEGIVKVLGVVNSFLGMLGPIPGIVAGIGGAFLAVTGTITAFSVALLAAAGAWRMMSGMTGSNIMQGVFSGRRAPQGADPMENAQRIMTHRPIDMSRRSGAAQWWYKNAFGVGQRMTAPPPEDPTMMQRIAGAAGSGARRVALFPLSRLRQVGRETLDTARHPFAYENRNMGANDPWSTMGMFTQGQAAIARARGSIANAVQRSQAAIGGAQIPMEDLRNAGPMSKVNTPLTYRVKADTSAAAEAVAAVKAKAKEQVTFRVSATGALGASNPAISGAGMDTSGIDTGSLLDSAATSATASGSEMGGRIRAAGATRGRIMGGIGRGVGAAVSGLETFAGAIGSVIGPLGMLAAVGVPLYHVFKGMHDSGINAARSMDDIGAALTRTAGGVYTKPEATTAPRPTPADKPDPFGQGERNTATSASFLASAGKDVDQLKLIGRGRNRNRAAQGLIQNVIANANNGQPLTASQQTALREELIAAYGADSAKKIMGAVNVNGVSASQAAADQATLLGATRNDANFFQNSFQGKNSAAQINMAVTPIANALNSGGVAGTARGGMGLVALAQSLNLPSQRDADIARMAGRAGGRAGPAINAARTDDVRKFQEGLGDIVAQLNKGVPDAQKIDINTSNDYTLRDFFTDLQSGNQRAKDFATNLTAAGVNLDDLKGSAKALQTALDKTTEVQTQHALALTGIGRTTNRLGFNISNPADVGYQSQMNILTQLAMVGGGTRRDFMSGNANNGAQPLAAALNDTGAIRKAITAWTDYKNALPGPNDPAYAGAQQMIDSLNAKLSAQNSIFMQPQQMAGVSLSQASHILNTATPDQIAHGQQGTDAQNYVDQAGQQITAAEAQLMTYMTQVHQAHIDQQHEEYDHNLQMSRMWRDHNLQQKEALYQRNMQLEEANYQFNEQIRQMNFQTAQSLGNPAQMVQSQFTMGAQSAMIGMNRQVGMLRDSKRTMDQLHKMGLSRDAIRLLGLDDPKNVEQAQRYLSDFAQNPKLIKSFNNSIKGRLKISDGIDTDVNNSKFADMRRQFNHTAEQATRAFNHSQTLTNQAFNRSLSDFQTDYNTSVTRQQQSLEQLGEQIYTNFDNLNQAAMESGLKNIEKFSSGIVRQIGRVRNVQSRLITEGINAINNSGAGGGGGGGGGKTGDTGITASGSQRGGGYGNVAVGGGGAGWTIGPNGKRTWDPGSGPSAYVKPGTGKVYGGAYRADYGPGGVDYRPTDAFMRQHPADPNFNRSIGKRMKPAWATGKQWEAWNNLWNNESGWNQYADNASSDAYGIPQSLPGTKMRTMGNDWRTNPATQIKWGINYIAGRYGDPINAWAHEQKIGWYAKGGVFGSPQTIGVGESGPEAVIPLNAMGATFVSRVVEQAIRSTGINRSMVAMSQTMPRASMVINAPVSHHEDHSTNFTGPVTVEASDPNEMARKLAARKRLDALRRPVAAR